jgi:PAS domain S-box-containing protein
MPLDSRLLLLADRFLEFIESQTGCAAIVCDETGVIVRATVRSRIGNLHAGAQRILRNEVDEAAITAEDAKANPLVKEGMNCPIVVEGRRVGTFGIAGPLETTRPLARVASVVLASWLKDMQQAYDTMAYQAELLGNLHDAVIGLDAAQIIRSWNLAAERTFGWKAKEVIGRHITDALPSEYSGRSSHEEFLRSLNREGRVHFNVRRRVRGGNWVDIEASAAVLRDSDDRITGYVSVNRDVTERKRIEAQLLLAERMASVGTLAAGVAHEVNNPLAYIVANLAFAVRELKGRLGDDPGEILTALGEASEGAVRVREIVQALKTFSRHSIEVDEPIDVEKVLRSSIKLAQNEIRHRARMVTEFSAVPLIRGSEQRLGQVFLNLLINAAQAIPEGKVHQNEIRAVTRLDDTGRVVVEIHDTGSGIALDVAERIFDPFFSTKPVGTGTGLGLSICHGIVMALGGEIVVESRVGSGSTFRLLFPVANEGRRGVAERSERPREATPSARGRILVVDDEPLICKSIARVLSPFHEVVALTSAREALLRLEGAQPFDVILCDLLMPEMSGMDFHSALLVRAPRAAERTAFLTGGAFTQQARLFLERVSNPRLEKPFDPAALREFVNKLLLGAAPSPPPAPGLVA